MIATAAAGHAIYIFIFMEDHKIIIQQLPVCILEKPADKHQCRGSSRSYCKNLFRRLSTGSPQDLLRRTQTRSCKDTSRMPPGPLQELLTRTCTNCTRSCKGPDSRICTSFAQGHVKNLEQDLHARTPKRISQDRHKRTCCCWSGPYMILIKRTSQEPPTRAFI